MATMNAAKGVVKQLFSVLTERGDHHLEVLKMSVSVLLYSLCKLNNLVDQNKLESRVIIDAFGMCEVALQDWVKQPNVIGGSFFGGRIQYDTQLVYGNAELQVYTLLFNACILHSAYVFAVVAKHIVPPNAYTHWDC